MAAKFFLRHGLAEATRGLLLGLATQARPFSVIHFGRAPEWGREETPRFQDLVMPRGQLTLLGGAGARASTNRGGGGWAVLLGVSQ